MATSRNQFISNATVSDTAGQLGSYETPVGYTDNPYHIRLHNSHTVPVFIELWKVPSGQSRTAATKFFARYISANETYREPMEDCLASGTQIHGDASVTAVVSVDMPGLRVTL